MTDPHAGADTPLDRKRRTARLYWLGLGVFGAHRFYLGLSLTGGLQLAATLVAVLAAGKTLVPLWAVAFWWLVDGFLIPQYCRPPADREARVIDAQDARQLAEWQEQYRAFMQRMDYARAADICRQALDRLEGSTGRESAAAARWQAWQAEAVRLRGHPEEAVMLLNQAIGLQERLHDDEGLCESLRYLALARMDEAHPEAAEPVYRRLLEKQQITGRGGRDRVATLIELADLYVTNHRPHEALPLYEEAVRLAPSVVDAGQILRVRAAIGEGRALLALERLDPARDAFRRAITQLEAAHDTAGFLMADCRRGLGTVHLRQGRLAEADADLTAAYRIRETLAPSRTATDTPFRFDAASGPGVARTVLADPSATAAILQDLLGVCIARHQSERAVTLAAHWAELQERILGAGHPRLARARARVAALSRSLGVPLPTADTPDEDIARIIPAPDAHGDGIAPDASLRAAPAVPHAAPEIRPEPDTPHRETHAIASIHTLDGAMHLVERVTGQPRRLYATRAGGADRYDGARSVLVPREQAAEFLDKLRDLLPLHFQAFIGTTHWQSGEHHEGWEELVILASDSPLECVRVAATAGEGLTNAQLLMRLRTWDLRYGVDVLGAEAESLTFRLFNPPSDAEAFYRELQGFCSNVAATLPDAAALAQRLADPTAVLRLSWLPARTDGPDPASARPLSLTGA